jgi:hypothetical protein
MEPISTLVLTAAFLVAAPATRRPQWEIESLRPKVALASATKTSYLFADSSTNATIPSTCELFKVEPQFKLPSISPRELLKREILTYSDFGSNWDGVDSAEPSQIAIQEMLAFIDAIPSRLSLPRPMISSSGEIGVYWDLRNGYAEVSFDSKGVALFFSRTDQGEEQFKENLTVNTLDDNWFWRAIYPMDSVEEMAA